MWRRVVEAAECTHPLPCALNCSLGEAARVLCLWLEQAEGERGAGAGTAATVISPSEGGDITSTAIAALSGGHRLVCAV